MIYLLIPIALVTATAITIAIRLSLLFFEGEIDE
jgi:hypothetical protein